MIRFALKCECGHRFESWFRDNNAYTALFEAKQLVCPSCGAATVSKAPMAPNVVSKAASREQSKEAELYERLRLVVKNVQNAVLESCDNVGGDFAEEARKIHYGEIPERSICGKTTDEESEELAEEGIEFIKLPWMKADDS